MRVSIIGAGAMGGAIAEGLLRSGKMAAADLTVANPHTDKLQRFAVQGVDVTTDNRKAASVADIVVVAVKPWLASQVLSEITASMDHSRQQLVSVMAGVTASDISKLTAYGATCARPIIAIPNTAAAVCASMTFIVAPESSEDDKARVTALFGLIGDTILIDESRLPAAMALASCGIAYALRYIRAASEGGVELGFRADDAKRIVTQTVMGAASLLQSRNSHPEEEIDRVTTAGGITIRGLNEMEHAGFTSAVIRGLKTAAEKH